MVGVAPRHKESQVMMERELNFYSKKMEAHNIIVLQEQEISY